MKFLRVLLFIFTGLCCFLFLLPIVIPVPKPTFNTPQDVIINNVKGKFITVNNYTTYIEDLNSESEKVITFIHGFGGSTYSWRSNKDYFIDNGYRVILIDLKGFGLSDKVLDTDYSHSAQADFIKSILDKLKVNKTILVGHSMGGNVVTIFTQKYPETVSKLVLVDAAILKEPGSEMTKLLELPPIRNIFKLGLSLYFTRDRFSEFLKSAYVNTDIITVEVIDRYYEPLQIKDWQDSLLGISRDSYKNAIPLDLSLITTPTLIIWGEKDPWIDINKGKELNTEIKDSTFVQIDNAGHLPMEEYPNIFNDVLYKAIKN